MRSSFRLLWGFAAVVALGGCKHPPSVVGQWKGTVLQLDGTIEFKDDKTVSAKIKEGGMGASFTGKYTVTPKQLSVTFSDYKTSSVPDELASAAKSLLDPIKNREYKLAYHFNNENELALTYQGKTDVLTRTPDAG